MADFARNPHHSKSVTYSHNRCLVETSWAQQHRRQSDTLTDTYSPITIMPGTSFSSDSGSESGYIMSPHASMPASPRTPVPWLDATDGSRDTQLALRGEMGKRKHAIVRDEERTAWALPGVLNILNTVGPDDRAQAVVPTRPKRRMMTPLSSPEMALSELSGPDDPITRSLNHGRRPEKGLLTRPTGLGDANVRFALPSRHAAARHGSQSNSPYPRQQPSPPGDEPRKGRAKPKGTHCNVKYLPEEQDFIRYHKIDLKESWNEVLQSFKPFQQRFPKDELDRRIQGLQGVHYRENYAIPKPRRESNGRQISFLPNGHVLAHACKVREQGEYKYMYGLVYLFPDRAMGYSWVRAEHRRFAAELNNERIQAQAQAKRDAMERGTWVEKLEDNSCMCCESEDRDMAGEPLRVCQPFDNDYKDGTTYGHRL
ncbi:hypothetical protein Micbo1qcDRAFT_231971 [Microdochium bolleyi]|uniref:Uncharacterized protein n=1 Tax=Microdochium bolleyi TaxID=196109 RepID=A0A136JBH0_9PEZI|nr:hypothetical protein Micbo1qcDRAFT_231971 [Microdochium bolleyi]